MVTSECFLSRRIVNVYSRCDLNILNSSSPFSIRLASIPGHRTVTLVCCIWQAGIIVIVTSSFKIVLTHCFPQCGATCCCILSSRAMNHLFDNFGLSLERSLSISSQLFASFSLILLLLQWQTALSTLAIYSVIF